MSDAPVTSCTTITCIHTCSFVHLNHLPTHLFRRAPQPPAYAPTPSCTSTTCLRTCSFMHQYQQQPESHGGVWQQTAAELVRQAQCVVIFVLPDVSHVADVAEDAGHNGARRRCKRTSTVQVLSRARYRYCHEYKPTYTVTIISQLQVGYCLKYELSIETV